MAETLSDKNSARMSFRLPERVKRRIERAAAESGLTVTDFAIGALINSADSTLAAVETRRLSDRDRDIFLNMLDSTATPNAALTRAAKNYKKMFGK